MEVRHFDTADLPAVHRLLVTSGWSHRIGSVDALGRLIAASQRATVALQTRTRWPHSPSRCGSPPMRPRA